MSYIFVIPYYCYWIYSSTIQFQWWHSGLYSQFHRWANPQDISCCCIINQRKCPHENNSKTEWSDSIIAWDIRLRLPSLITIVSSAHTTLWHFHLLLLFFCFVDTGTYLPPHKPNMTAVLFVQFTSQTNTHVVDQYAPHIHMHLTTTIPRDYYPPLTYTDPPA